MKCLCCGAINLVRRGQKSGYNIGGCQSCDFEFVYPRPSYHELESHYNKSIPKNIRQMISISIDDIKNNPRWHASKRDWFDLVLDTAKRNCNKEKLDILEIGSAFGYFVHYANTLGHNAIGSESTKEFASSSKGLINGEILFIEDNQYGRHFSEDTFDLVYMEHVFEHLIEPETILKRVRPLLRQNGVIFVSIPNHKSLLSKFLGLSWPWVNPPGHLYYYNKDSITRLFNRYGYKVEKSWTGDYFFRSIYQFYSLDTLANGFIRLLNKYLKTNLPTISHSYRYPESIKDIITLTPYWIFFPIIKWSDRHGMGSELIVIARKCDNFRNSGIQ